jgi:hypothetical protein
MTITVAANLTEGVIFGADSACSYIDLNNNIQKVFDGAQKIYHIGAEKDTFDSPFGAMIYGSSHYGGQAWRTIFANFWRLDTFNEISKSGNSFITALISYLSQIVPEKEKRGQGGLFIAGFGKEDKMVNCFKIDINSLIHNVLNTGTLSWDGLPLVVQRLVFGIDNATIKSLTDNFKDLIIEVIDECARRSWH